MNHLFTSQRLGFRNWEEKDIPKMAAISGDPEVMQYFPSTSTIEQTRQLIYRMQTSFKERGYCYFAVDRLDTGEMIGFIGLMYQDYDVDFNPCVDIGWRLKKNAWRQGFASEGASACLDYAFRKLELESVVAVATCINIPSEGVMQKIGMKKVKEFVHPKLIHDERLKDCILYEIKKEDWTLT